MRRQFFFIRCRNKQQPIPVPIKLWGGADDPSARPPRLFTVAALLVGLAVFAIVPRPTYAQTNNPSCTPSAVGYPPNPLPDPIPNPWPHPSITFSGNYQVQVKCSGLSGGMALTLNPGVTIGSSDTNGRVQPAQGWEGALFLDGYETTGTRSAGDNPISIKGSATIYSSGDGIVLYHDGSRDTNNKVLLELDHQAGTVDAGGIGIRLEVRGRVVSNSEGESVPFTTTQRGDIKVTLGSKSRVEAGQLGVKAHIITKYGKGDIVILHNGRISSGRAGIWAQNDGAGDITITTEIGSSIEAKYFKAEDKRGGIHAVAGGTGGAITINHKGTINSGAEGIFASNKVAGSASAITITTGEDPTSETPSITADRQGIRLSHGGTGTFAVTILGTVIGDNAHTSGTAKYAGVHIEKGSGMIVVGPKAHVSSKSGQAIKVDTNAGNVKVILNEDSGGYVGHVKGDILGATGTLTFYTRMGTDGDEKQLEKGDIVYWRGTKMGVYDEVIEAKLTTITGGYEFVEETFRLYQPRAKLYEVLPAVLLGLMEPISYSARTTTPRMVTGEEVVVAGLKGESVTIPESRSGIWVRLEASDGEREASTSSSAKGKLASASDGSISHAEAGNRQSNSRLESRPLSWEVKQTGVALGLDVPTDDGLMLGMNVHYRQVKTTVKDGGTAEATGTGLGLSLTHTNDDGLYVDGQLIYTRFFGVTVSSDRNGRIVSGGRGSGLTVGVEVGQQMTMANMTVIPRGSLSWSSVDMDDFVEPAAIDGNGTVAPEKGESVVGRVGVLTELGPVDTDARMYASLDLEHEFSPELEVIASGVKLKTEVEPTWVRVGLGGSVPLGSAGTTMLVGEAYYATAGSGNTEFGGGVTLDIRF